MLSGNSRALQCWTLLLILSGALGAKILGIFPTPGRSHYILESTLMRALSDAGHQVTIVSPFHEPYQSAGNGSYRQIVLTGVAEAQKERRRGINLFERASMNPLSAIYVMNKIGLKQTESTLQHAAFQALIHSGERFDAVVVGQFMNDALKGMAHHFGGHLILFSSVGTSTWVNHLVGNPSMPSYTPEMILSYPASMTYWQRATNALVNALYNANQHLVFYPRQNALLRQYVPNAVDLSDALFNVSLVLMNTHESIAFPTSAVPCMKHIGGFHVKAPAPLPNELQAFLDQAAEGVVYFSLGSNVNTSHLPAPMRQAILEVLAQRPQRILLKFDEPPATPLPANVMQRAWFPQQDVLAHPNVRLFITHGGFASTIETVHYGVPIIAIPIFGDQRMNAIYAETKGFGRILPWQSINVASFGRMVAEVLGNPRYREAARRKSQLLRDREVAPLATAVYWIEYVLRHNGAPHLRVASLELAWYQYYLLDVYLPIVLLPVVVWQVLRRLMPRRGQKIKTS
ncbi:UDP-glucosyltransferase 2 [Dendroctonus ponderosae]|uniref:UDP-glucosyltransferase 2 n=1 Tax=Dendroctonus ponderosae TaxID=77166 RepID=UPI0020363470|nr:UDP-glucosyltransferase 2 [Dendroctonus ponderosae]